MTLLALLWWVSLILVITAVGWMAGLMVARLFRERAEARRADELAALTLVFLAVMSGEVGAAARLHPFFRRTALIAEVLLDMLGLVRGVERDRLIAALAGFNVDSRLRSRLQRGGTAGRLACVEALAVFPSAETRLALHALSRRSPSLELRVAAVRTLIDLGASPSIRQLLSDIGAPGRAEPLLYAPVLKQLAAASPDEALEAFESGDTSAVAMAMLADALGASGDYRAVDALTVRAHSDSPTMRAASVRALGALGHPAAVAPIAHALTDDHWEVRAEASEAAGRVGATALAPDLVSALADPVWWVRFRAAEALAAMGPRGIRCLRVASRAQVDNVRRAASLALAERGLA